MQTLPDSTEQKKFELLGRLSWLWMSSPIHRNWSTELLARFTLSPIALNQYMLIERDNYPVAYCSWAYFSLQAELDYLMDATYIDPNHWNSGDRLWFIDWIAPFSKNDSIEMKNQLIEKFPQSVGRALRFKPQNKKMRVMEFNGRELEKKQAKEISRLYYAQFLDEAKKKYEKMIETNL